jgi:hypothetical protein
VDSVSLHPKKLKLNLLYKNSTIYCDADVFQFSVFQDISHNSVTEAQAVTRMDGPDASVQSEHVDCGGSVRRSVDSGALCSVSSKRQDGQNIRFVCDWKFE